MAPYHFSVTVHEEFESAVARTKQALAANGFGIVSEIDLAATLRERLGVEHDPYLILGACNPEFARIAIRHAPAIGVLLPCNVVLRSSEGDGVVVDFMDPAATLQLVNDPHVQEIAEDVRSRLEMTRDDLATSRRVA